MGKTGTLGIDPAKDVAALIGNQCFMCGKVILFSGDLGWFGPKPKNPLERATTVELPHHLSCAHGVPAHVLVTEYNRRIHDLANVTRTH